VLTLLRDAEWGKWSDSEIARRCAVHHSTVATLRKESSLADFASEAGARTYTTKHGTPATMRTTNIGVRPHPPQEDEQPRASPVLPLTGGTTYRDGEAVVVVPFPGFKSRTNCRFLLQRPPTDEEGMP
jgi:hypothetical protein